MSDEHKMDPAELLERFGHKDAADQLRQQSHKSGEAFASGTEFTPRVEDGPPAPPSRRATLGVDQTADEGQRLLDAMRTALPGKFDR